jgi:ribosomal protein L10
MATTPNAAKAAVVTEVKQMLSGVDAALITEYRGLSVGSLATLRRALRPLGAEYKVYKNTLASRAAQEAGFEGLSQFLVGPTAITFVKGDASAAAKALRDHAKTNPLLVLKGGVVGGRRAEGTCRPATTRSAACPVRRHVAGAAQQDGQLAPSTNAQGCLRHQGAHRIEGCGVIATFKKPLITSTH